MILRFKANKFKCNFEHVAIEARHAVPLKYFDLIFKFLETNFVKQQTDKMLENYLTWLYYLNIHPQKKT